MRKRNLTKAAAVVMTLALTTAAALTGCGGTQDEGNASTAAQTQGQEEAGEDTAQASDQTEVDAQAAPEAGEQSRKIGDGNVTLTVFCGIPEPALAYYNDLGDNPVVQWMEEQTGLDLQFVHPPAGDDGSFFQQMLASGELPDIMSTNVFETSYPGGVEAAMNDGVLYDVTELVEQNAVNFKALCDEEQDPDIEKKIRGDEGKIVKFGTIFLPPTCNQKIMNGIMVRQDWLEKYNLEEPVTLDDYTNVLRVFKENGVEVPFAMCKFDDGQLAASNVIASAFDVTYKDFALDDAGNVHYSRTQDGYKEFLKLMNLWAKEGLIDTDFVSRDKWDSLKLFQNGTAGMCFTHTYDVKVSVPLGEAVDPEFKLLCLEMPKQKAGDVTHLSKITTSINTSSWQVSANCEHPEEAVAFIDYLMAPEVMQATAWGVNGEVETFTEDADGKRTFTEFVTDNPDGLDYDTIRSLYMCTNLQVKYDEQMESEQYSPAECHQSWEAWSTNNDGSHSLPIYLTFTSEESKELTQIKTKLSNYSDEMVYRFVFGDADIDSGWDTFVEECRNLGSERAEEINKAAYDRYTARDKQ